MQNEDFIQLAVREFQRMKTLADKAVDQMPRNSLFAVPNGSDNSIAIIMKHMAGNMRSRWTDFLSADGEKTDRDRDAEFTLFAHDTHQSVLARWEEGWQALFDALAPLTSADLGRTVTIPGEPLSVLQAITRQLTHYSYHVGQIVYLAKSHAGEKWRSLSIPIGKSQQFTRAPEAYLQQTRSAENLS